MVVWMENDQESTLRPMSGETLRDAPAKAIRFEVLAIAATPAVRRVRLRFEEPNAAYLGFVGLELFDVVHVKYRKMKRYCSTWNVLAIR
jgi:hypothetical protein